VPALGRTAVRLAGRLEKMRPTAGGISSVGRGAHPTAPEGGRAPRDRALPRHFPKIQKNQFLVKIDRAKIKNEARRFLDGLVLK